MALKDSTGNTARMNRLRFRVPGNRRANLLRKNNLDMQVAIKLTRRTLPNEQRRSYKADCILLQLQLPTCFQTSAEKKELNFTEGMPGNAKTLFPKSKQPGILILEDLMISTMNKDEEALHTVTVTAH